ncbi:MAG: stimulus-sensing domain-containing protein [Parvibaculales bacterium]
MSSDATPSPAPADKARDKKRPKQKLLARLIVLNMLGLLILAGGILTLSESRQVLTRAYTKSLQTQASIIASALSQATQQNNFEFFEPSILKQLNGRRANTWQIRQAQKIMRDMRNVTDARLRLYANNGNLIIDSMQLDRSINVVSRDLPPLLDNTIMPSWLEAIKNRGQHFIFGAKPVLNEITAADGFRLPEVATALKGQAASLQRQNENGHDVLTVAVPVQGYRAIVGALMISTHPGEIDAIIAEERQLVFELSGLALVISVITSLLIAGTIVVPVRRLASAMRGFGGTMPQLPGLDSIPDLSRRGDEIGDLSVALRDMMQKLLLRINTIDRFAADVAHELKNPLTSLHSAVQSLDQAPNKAQQKELMAIIDNDLHRLNRLISDISNATRLDAELNRGESDNFDLSELAQEIGQALAVGYGETQNIQLIVQTSEPCLVMAQKARIAQIIDNLIGNAASFSPEGSRIFITTRIESGKAMLIVADEGPGLADGTAEKIFDRFYTDRTQAPVKPMAGKQFKAGNSGLGLSISRQIARAHGGDVIGNNRPDGQGAYFTLILPLHDPKTATA